MTAYKWMVFRFITISKVSFNCDRPIIDQCRCSLFHSSLVVNIFSCELLTCYLIFAIMLLFFVVNKNSIERVF